MFSFHINIFGNWQNNKKIVKALVIQFGREEKQFIIQIHIANIMMKFYIK